MSNGKAYLESHLKVVLQNLEKKIDLLKQQKGYVNETANMKMLYELALEQTKNENSDSTTR